MSKGVKPLLVALGLTTTGWLLLRKRKTMSQLPVSVGDASAQQRFIAAHEPFLLEFPKLKSTLEMLIDESHKKVSEQRSNVTDASQTDEDIAKPIVFSLARATYDDFVELLVLAGNGMGLGATKVLRSIYERLVTAMYIAKKPYEARLFMDQSAIERGKIINRYKAAVPGRLAEDFTSDALEEIQKRFAEAECTKKSRFLQDMRSAQKSRAWTRVSLDTMAKEVSQQLFDAYTTCYLQPTFLGHATPTGLDFRVRFIEGGWEYKHLSEPEAHGAVMRGHFLMLGVLSHLNAYFEIGRDDEVRNRFEAFDPIWSEDSQKSPARTRPVLLRLEAALQTVERNHLSGGLFQSKRSVGDHSFNELHRTSGSSRCR